MPAEQRSHASDGPFENVLLIGAGVVGQAIAQAHLAVGIDCYLADLDSDAVERAARGLESGGGCTWNWVQEGGVFEKLSDLSIALCRPSPSNTPTASNNSNHVPTNSDPTAVTANHGSASSWLIIESIVEQLSAKRSVFARLQRDIGAAGIYLTNTSTLRIADIAEELTDASRFCGMHFFMPIANRDAVEIISHPKANPATLSVARRHASRLGKTPLPVKDSPGFLVNRLLSPYLNQALLLLTTGATESQIARAAATFGMPLSPLELIDWIGAPTLFHAGRVFWQSFPDRLDPSPMVAGLVKGKFWGRQSGVGLYRYEGSERSDTLSPEATQLVERYRTDSRTYQDDDVERLLCVPMWIESELALRDGVVDDPEMIDAAMKGGLGYRHRLSWQGYFEQLGQAEIERAIDRWSPLFRSMRRPE